DIRKRFVINQNKYLILMLKERFFKLRGVVQHYAWGGTTFIPALVGISNEEQKPCAEYWMGAHASAPSMLQLNGETIG
ncbi:type I phosphomannose isomerase catalytic subunit, partial [Acinetobacter baumannii]